MNPYCQHAECHDAVTSYYLRRYSTGFSEITYADFWPFPGARRLCGIHAREELGWSWGGRPTTRRPVRSAA